MITQCQTQFSQAMMQIDPSVPEMFGKLRRPYEDTLKILGVKDVDAYLPTMEEAQKLAQAAAAKPPSPESLETKSKTDLNNANTQKAQADIQLIGAKTQETQAKSAEIQTGIQFEALAASRGKLNAVEVN